MKPSSDSEDASLEAHGVVRRHETDEEESAESARAKRQRRQDLSSEGTAEEQQENGREDAGGESKEATYSPSGINLAEAAMAPFVNPADDQGTRGFEGGV